MESAVRISRHGALLETMDSDSALLQRLKGGDLDAFEALYGRYRERVFRVLYRLVGDDADDVTQEVFLRLYRRPPAPRSGELAAWLYRVATNLGFNALRGRRRRDRHRDALGARTAGHGWLGADGDPQELVEAREEAAVIRGGLRRLSKRQATLLVLRYSGLSYREISEVLAVSAGSVGTLLARAERGFKAAYERATGIEAEARDGVPK